MPSNFSYLDTNFPTFTAGQNTETKITQVQNYLYMLLEQLRYTLNNLDERNFNETGLGNITEPIYARIEDSDGYVSELALNAEKLAARLETDEGYISQLQLDARSLRTELYDSKSGDVTQLQATAGSLTSQVSGLSGDVSTLGQTVNGMYLSVSNGTESSTISLVRNGVSVSSQTIRFTGDVVFASDLENGNTVIDGGCIRTGYISSEYIEITGAVATYAGEGGDLTGYLGYVEGMNADGDTTYGIGITAVNSRGRVQGQCYVTDSGARLAFRALTAVTCTEARVTIRGWTGGVEIYPEGSSDCWVFGEGSIYWSGTGQYVQLA